MHPGDVRIAAKSVACPIGLSPQQAWAACRARIGRQKRGSIQGRHTEGFTMALLPEEVLGELDEGAVPAGTTDIARRLLKLGRLGLQTLGALPSPAPLFFALPEPQDAPLGVSDSEWLDAFVRESGAPIDIGASVLNKQGRAGGFFALAAAIEHLNKGKDRTVIVGGVDTYLDPLRLAALDMQERLLVEGRMNGFIPGEGAAFVVLTNAPAAAGEAAVIVSGVGTALDKGHRYSADPDLGVGLADAIEALRWGAAISTPAEVIFAGFNGEAEQAKEWGVAQVRHRDILSPDAMLEHPADGCGDLGAATGPVLIAMANTALSQGHREGPALVWASSDREPCGCAWLALQG